MPDHVGWRLCRNGSFLLVAVLLLILAAGCVPGDGQRPVDRPAGFFAGIWHGWLAPVSLIWGFFNRSIRIYEVNNTGWWYDLGYYMAVISGFGSLSLSRERLKKKKNDD